MQYLKADTQVKVVIGPVVAVGDGFTPVTTLALTTADEAEIMKHDAASVTDISGNTFAAITSADGYYNLTITAAQLDTEGMMTVLINDDSLCLPVRHDFMVVNANVYDSLFAAATTDYLQVDTIQISGTAQTANDVGQDVNDILVDTGTTLQAELDGIQADTEDIQTRLPAALVNGRMDSTVDGTGMEAAAVAAIADGVWDELQSGHVGAGSFGEIATEIASILTDTAEIGAAGAGLTAINLPDQTMNITGNITGNLSGSVGSVTGAVGSVTGNVGGNVAGSVASVTGNVGGSVASVTGGINTAAGTITTLDGLDTAQDTQHSTTQTALATVDGIVDNLNSGIITGSAVTGTLSTTQATTDLTGYADDQLIGRVIIFLSGDCEGEATDITDYANTGGLITFTALTTAPANGDTFKIV